MCTNIKPVRNPYTGKVIYAKCGECPSCQLDRAKRQLVRLVNTNMKDRFNLFFSLTYDNNHVPYVKLSDLDFGVEVPVYRQCDSKYVQPKGLSFPYLRHKFGEYQIDAFTLTSKADYRRLKLTKSLPNPVDMKLGEVVAVCCNQDFSKFIKRFCINFYRATGKKIQSADRSFGYYRVSEYGPTTFRPHFHVLFTFASDLRPYYEQIKAAIVKSWPMCNPDEFSNKEHGIQEAISPNDYISKYTCRPADMPKALQVAHIRARPSFSTFIGRDNVQFNGDHFLACIANKAMEYVSPKRLSSGLSVLTSLCLPRYVTRWFIPAIKSAYKFTDGEIEGLCRNPESCLPLLFSKGYTYDEYKSLVNNINIRKARICLSDDMFAQMVVEFRRITRSHVMASQFNDDQMLYPDLYYDNLFDSHDERRLPLMRQGYKNINETPNRMAIEQPKIDEYNANQKQRKIFSMFSSRRAIQNIRNQKWFNFKFDCLCPVS